MADEVLAILDAVEDATRRYAAGKTTLLKAHFNVFSQVAVARERYKRVTAAEQPPTVYVVTISTIPDVTDITAGANYSESLSSYVGGADAGLATFTLEAVSGTLGGVDLSFSYPTLSGTTPDVGTVSLQMVGKIGGVEVVRSNTFIRGVTAAAPPDVYAPAEVFGLGGTIVSPTRIDLYWDWPAEATTPTIPATERVKVAIERRLSGQGSYAALTTQTAPADQPNPAISAYSIGTMTSPLWSQSGADHTLTVTDGNFNNTTDNMLFVGGLLNGDGEVSCYVPDIVSAYSWSQGGIGFRDAASLGPSFLLAKRTSSNAAGSPAIWRLTQGATSTGYGGDVNQAAGKIWKVTRVADLFSYYVWDSASLTWVLQTSQTISAAAVLLAGMWLTRTQAGAAISVTFSQFRISKNGAGSYSDTTVSASTAYDYRARALDSA